jgi:hypothetical protein
MFAKNITKNIKNFMMNYTRRFMINIIFISKLRRNQKKIIITKRYNYSNGLKILKKVKIINIVFKKKLKLMNVNYNKK